MRDRSDDIIKAYEYAKKFYSSISVDTDRVIDRINSIAISIHCWQGDDISGFEDKNQIVNNAIQATGNYPGKARNVGELRMDLEKACEFIPGEKKLSLHAMYPDTDKSVPRDMIGPEHFESWAIWAMKQGIGLDFNPTCFAHPMANDGLTLSHPDKQVRDFWIRHVRKSRKISEFFGKKTGKQSIMNLWIPDGFKDTPADRLGSRKRLRDSLDMCFEDTVDRQFNLDAVESKLFGIGSESCVVGSHEFYLGYAIENRIAVCLDTGHFHPTEKVSEKLSAVSLFLHDILLHVSRPVRWDSDHVVTLDEELVSIAQEIIHNNLERRIRVGLDFFDGSINRIAAWVIGTRNVRKALLIAALQPVQTLFQSEEKFDYTARLAWFEELKSFPWSAVWDYYCLQTGVMTGLDWLASVRSYESEVLMKR